MKVMASVFLLLPFCWLLASSEPEKRSVTSSSVNSTSGTNSAIFQRMSDGFSESSLTSRTRSARCFNRVAATETNGDDFVTGTPRAEEVHVLRGDDIAFMDAGDDRICGGKGDDTLNGGLGYDRIDGGRGFDTCDGEPGEKIRNCERRV